MGYTTDFSGEFELNKPLKPKHAEYLKQFARTRRVKRNGEETIKLPDPVRLAAKLPIGDEGGYYVGDKEDFGQSETSDIIDYNCPPKGQPGLWNQWVPSEDLKHIEWDGGEKFYAYTEWLKYLIEHFLKPWGYKLNGQVEWTGEDPDDRGLIICKNNVVTTKRAVITYQ